MLEQAPDTAKFPNHHGVGVDDERRSFPKLRHRYMETDSPAISACCSRHAFSSAVTLKLSNRLRHTCLHLSFPFLLLMSLCLWNARSEAPSIPGVRRTSCREVAKLQITKIFGYSNYKHNDKRKNYGKRGTLRPKQIKQTQKLLNALPEKDNRKNGMSSLNIRKNFQTVFQK